MGLDKYREDSRSEKDKIKENIDKEWLKKKVCKGHSDREISEELDIDRRMLTQIRNEWDIKASRDKADPLDGEIKLNSFQQDIIIGDLLSDGCITKSGKGYRYQTGDKHIEYLEFIVNIMPNDMFTDNSINSNKNDFNYLTSRNVDIFTHMRDTWYPDGDKILPENIELNSTHFLMWYMGDGNLRTDRNAPRIHISWLDEDSVDQVHDQLTQLVGKNISMQSNSGGIDVYVKKKSKDNFFKLIGNPPVECYEYKWPDKYLLP